MKKLFLIVLLVSSFIISNAQDLPDFDLYKFKTEEDYNADADNAALIASNYLLTTKYDKTDMKRAKCARYLIRWMTGTPAYSFEIDETAGNISKKDPDMLSLYMACMTKYALTNKDKAKDTKLVKLNSYKMLIGYCKNAQNGVKPAGELKKLLQADEKGELEKYLKI